MEDKVHCKKTRGAWMISVKRANTGQGSDTGPSRCSSAPSGGMPHHNKHENAKEEKEE